MRNRPAIGRRMSEYTPALLDFLEACEQHDDALCKQILESDKVLFNKKNIDDFFNQYRDDLYLSKDNLNLLLEKYSDIIPSDLQSILLFAAKRGYVTLIKRMTQDNESLLQEILHEMCNHRYNLACWKRIIYHVFQTEAQKNKMIISCIRELRLNNFTTLDERAEIIAIFDYLIRAIPRNCDQGLNQSALVNEICYAYNGLILSDFNETLHPRYIALIQLLIDRNYLPNESILNLEFLVCSLQEIGQLELAEEYLDIIYQVPQVQLYRARLHGDIDKFKEIVRYHEGNQQVTSYLLFLENEYRADPNRHHQFHSYWQTSDIRKKLLEEKDFSAKKSALQANHLHATPPIEPPRHPISQRNDKRTRGMMQT